MKNLILAVVLTCLSGVALAAAPVTAENAQQLQKIGVVSSQASTLNDFGQAIAADAKQQGASGYRITSVTVNNHVYGTANLYK
ncbi:YdgH/BhsA/McbA-like domain containing protein [Serratia quinivorans]|uniref:YdgH/BhsA/McbA-like domain containing protein n=1 Tax=Serratia quinivorans TaxID=137545 RepID=UPI0021779DF5|nr:YdgH/BhsA/McbA-like domain containing protein [Serratia quinivorans]CAI0918399.1 Multiple stress resistance protein BhsA precursor [Serratia quinivorans]CAI0940286.1 Multiple stress resistance protein BhsA precursor [Serratia quinivorans]CAI1530788.1 Multiple stress resistance protein BhsA precursor [Serratia quinivorans]CAI2062838.1 Multiple stress resistance protein BhsA precursor [Serratia quinivorans]CAI2097726.1 Multiple stress resistance protein BhsA precursor [Serratia quinivorans]